MTNGGEVVAETGIGVPPVVSGGFGRRCKTMEEDAFTLT